MLRALRAQHIAFTLMLLLSSCLIASAAVAADQAISPPKAGAKLAQLFVRPVTLRGTLNGAQIQMTLHLKPDEEASLEGSYFLFGQNHKILLAGEFEEDALMMEESINGKDVSGLWDGVYDGTVLSGNWSSLDGSVLRPFVLKVVPAGQ
ncbi:MAG: hypothetical protein JWQ10_2395 [Herbaspirillum sp.]|nr:hypothetical protein [Herbaspirillum sp.]